MKRYISWNNRRRTAFYWISAALLLLTAMNPSVWFGAEDPGILGKFQEALYKGYEAVLPRESFLLSGADSLLSAWLTGTLLLLLLLAAVNQLIGQLPDGRDSLLWKTAVLMDLAVGILLEWQAAEGLWKMGESFRLTSAALWVYALFFAAGSLLYWKSVLPAAALYRAAKSLRDGSEFEKKAWFCLTNGPERCSSFARVPWKGRITELLLDGQDLEQPGKPGQEAFLYYLLVLDCRKEISGELEERISRIVRYPHSRILALCFGSPQETEPVKSFLGSLSGSIRAECFPEGRPGRELDLERIIRETDFRGAEETKDKRNPLRYIKNQELVRTYLGVGTGPRICLDFLKEILTKLDLLPAVYALFDYTDLQYRLMLACAVHPDLKWLRQKSRIIGNIGTMKRLLEERVIAKNHAEGKNGLTFRDIFSEILTEEELEIIRKYLPNYEKQEERPVEDTIVYLTASFRNVLRGHGTFDSCDAEALFELVLKLALMNTQLLAVNELSLSGTGERIWEEETPRCYQVKGGLPGEEEKILSPFLILEENGSLLVFNNWNKGVSPGEGDCIEYINYLDGTLILPRYRNIDTEKKEEAREEGGAGMLENVKINMLIPVRFDAADFDKIADRKRTVGKERAKELQAEEAYGSGEWFDYCFRFHPVGRSYQLESSPLLDPEGGCCVRRVELNQPVRARLGLHQNENCEYLLSRGNIPFYLGKLRLLFFPFGTAFIQIEITARELGSAQLLDLNAQLGAVRLRERFSYLAADPEDFRKKRPVFLTMRQLIEKLLSLQSYVPLSPYEGETLGKAYTLVYFTGQLPEEEEPFLLEMLRGQRKSGMRAGEGIRADKLYKPFAYISWAAGDRTLAGFGDTEACGEGNRDFVAGPGGLVKSVSENYLVIYAYFIALRLLAGELERRGAEAMGERAEALLKLPLRNLSTETHINELFEIYLCRREWKLLPELKKLKSRFSEADMKKTLESIRVSTEYMKDQLSYLVDFARTDLTAFLAEKRKKVSEQDESSVESFILDTSDYIGWQIHRNTGSVLLVREQKRLEEIFGSSAWKSLTKTSQTSLISAGVLWRSCGQIETADFDFSGVCICVICALEKELRRTFFDGLVQYMSEKYGKPCRQNAEAVYQVWPEELLSIPRWKLERDQRAELKPSEIFTLGRMPYLFGAAGTLADKPYLRQQQLAQAELMKKRMTDYLGTIMPEGLEHGLTEAFTKPSGGSFVDRCERIRKNYRNRAAHVGAIGRAEAEDCCESIVGFSGAGNTGTGGAGILPDLYQKVDGSRLLPE